MQVSDRFHLWQGLSRRVQDIASAHRGCLPAALPPIGDAASARVEATIENTTANTRAERHARRLFEAIQALTRSGRSHSSVARELGLNRRTVSKYARANTWQEVVRRPPRKPSTLDSYLDYLQQRWDEGQHSAKILHEELQAKGYLGHYQRVKMAVAPLRKGLPIDEPRERPHEALQDPPRRKPYAVTLDEVHGDAPAAEVSAVGADEPTLVDGDSSSHVQEHVQEVLALRDAEVGAVQVEVAVGRFVVDRVTEEVFVAVDLKVVVHLILPAVAEAKTTREGCCTGTSRT
ncbi:hypothetical protein [Streptomyces sp. NPDC048350]|uniref:hypothetical protein n=1 Tax=Streptomyces sp. NPDC048350 TaxID=3365538 RepID=UPI003715649D